MASVIDRLFIALRLDNSQVKKGVKEVDTSFKNLQQTAVRAFAVIAGANTLRAVVRNYLDTATAVGTLAESLSLSVNELTKWQNAVNVSGRNVSGFNSTIQSLTNSLDNIYNTGTDSSLTYFNQLGISINSATKSTDLLLQLSGRFARLNDRQARYYGRQLGIDPDTIQLLRQGRSSLQALLKSQEEYAKHAEADAKAALEFRQQLARLRLIVNQLTASIVRTILPALKTFLGYLEGISNWVRRNGDFVKIFFITLATIIGTRLIPTLFRLGIAWAAALWPLALIVAIAAAIALLIEDFLVWQRGGKSFFNDLWKNVVKVYEAIEPFVKAFMSFFDAPLENLKNLLKKALTYVKTTLTEFKNSAMEVFADIRDFIFDIIDQIQQKIEEAFKLAPADFAKSISRLNPFTSVASNILDFAFGDQPDVGATTTNTVNNNSSPTTVTATTSINEININTPTIDGATFINDLRQYIRNESKVNMAIDGVM